MWCKTADYRFLQRSSSGNYKQVSGFHLFVAVFLFGVFLLYFCLFLQCAQSMFIPQLVQKALPECAVVLRCLATELKVNYRKDLLLLNFNFIFSYLVRNCSGEELKEALAFVEVASFVVKY